MNFKLKNIFISSMLLLITQSNLIAENVTPDNKDETTLEETKNDKFESKKLEKLSKTLGIAEIIATVAEIMVDHNANPGSRSMRRDNQKENLKRIKVSTFLSKEIINSALEKKDVSIVLLLQLIAEEYKKYDNRVNDQQDRYHTSRENIRRLQNIPGFDNFTVNNQRWRINGFHANGVPILMTNINSLEPIFMAFIQWILIMLHTSIYEGIISKVDNRIHRRVLRVMIYSFAPVLIDWLLTEFNLLTRTRDTLIKEEFLNLNLINTLMQNILIETSGELLLQELEKTQVEKN